MPKFKMHEKTEPSVPITETQVFQKPNLNLSATKCNNHNHTL